MTIAQNIETIANSMANLETISTDAAEKLFAILDKAPREALQMIVDRKIKFMWMPAKRRLMAMEAK